MNIFRVLDDTEPNYIKAQLITPDWIIHINFSYFDWEYGDFEFYGDEPFYQYVGENENIPEFDLDDDDLCDMIYNATWK